MKRTLFFLSILSVLFFSCEYDEEPQEISIDNQFEITVPSWLKKTNRLNPDAELQMENKFRAVYLLLVKDSLNSSPEDFLEAQIQLIDKGIKKPKVSSAVKSQINSYLTYDQSISGRLSEEDIHYELKTFRSNESTFALIIWTKKEKLSTFGTDIENIFNSLK